MDGNSHRAYLIRARNTVKEWCNKTPFVSLLFTAISLFGSILSLLWFQNSLLQILVMNDPQKTIFELQFHRILVSWVIPASFLGGLFQTASIVPLMRKIETKKGSVFLLLHIVVLQIATQILFSIVIAPISLLITPLKKQISIGMWTIFFNLLPIVLSEPFQERRVPFFTVKIPQTIYPFILCLFFQLFGPSVDIFFAAFVGYLARHKYRYLNLNLEQLKRCERFYVFRYLRTRLDNFALADKAEYNGLPNFIPFDGSSQKVEGDISINQSRTFTQNYKPHKYKEIENEELSSSSKSEELDETIKENIKDYLKEKIKDNLEKKIKKAYVG